VLVYASMRAASTLRSFYFFQKIERLEIEARRLAGFAEEGPAATAGRKKVVNEVAALRRDGEMKSYVDLLFLAMVVLLCVAKIVTD
jgi:hypothetical protein